MGGGTLDFKDSTEFQRQTVTARRYTASTNNVSLETEICGGAEQALIASFVLSPHIDKTIPLPLISILPPVHCARPKLILGGTGFSSWQLLGCRYLEYIALKLVCLCYHSIGVLSLYWCVTTLLSSHSVWHCLKLSIVCWTKI